MNTATLIKTVWSIIREMSHASVILMRWCDVRLFGLNLSSKKKKTNLNISLNMLHTSL